MVTGSIVLTLPPGRLSVFDCHSARRLPVKTSVFDCHCDWRPPVRVSGTTTRMSFMTSISDTNAASDAATQAEIPRISLQAVVLDTDDPQGLAEFYAALLGWEIEPAEDDWVTINGGSSGQLDFQLAINHKPPTWPDNAIPQQSHLDLHVDDLNEAAAYAESIGARRAANGDHSPNFIVFLDPSGHPFCLCS
jgi:predicted enzyme related to lactoylglutathione lyase